MHPTASRALPPDQARWAFEAKWDGYRALAHAAAGQVRLRSRHGVDMTGWFPELAGLGAALAGHGAVLDGEVVALDAQGRPDFEALQRRMRARAGVRAGRRPVAYLFFDLLWLDGRLLCPAPYAERRRLLDGLGLAGPAWQPVASFPDEGTALLAATRAQGLEGVVAKRLDSPYLPRRPPPAGRAPGGHAGRGQPVRRGPGGAGRRPLAAGGRRGAAAGVRAARADGRGRLPRWEAGRLRHATLG